MSEEAKPAPVADSSREPPKLEAPYTMRVSIRRWDEHGKQFLNEHRGLPAYTKEGDGVTAMVVIRSPGNTTSEPVKGSEIICPDGTVYVVSKMVGGGQGGDFVCYVTTRP